MNGQPIQPATKGQMAKVPLRSSPPGGGTHVSTPRPSSSGTPNRPSSATGGKAPVTPSGRTGSATKSTGPAPGKKPAEQTTPKAPPPAQPQTPQNNSNASTLTAPASSTKTRKLEPSPAQASPAARSPESGNDQVRGKVVEPPRMRAGERPSPTSGPLFDQIDALIKLRDAGHRAPSPSRKDAKL